MTVVINNNSNKKHNWVIAVLLILLGLLIIALYKGCDNVNKGIVVAINHKERIKKLEQDSAKAYQDSIDYVYKDSLEDGQLALSDNRIKSLTENLDSANDRIAILLKNHIPIKPSSDTDVTIVPNAFITDCSSCFTELEKGLERDKKYRAEVDNRESLFKSQINTKETRIKSLELVNKGLANSYRSLLADSDTDHSNPEQRRTLFFKLGMLSVNQNLPNGGGIGLIYEDKKKRLFIGGAYLTNYGAVYQFDMAFPLSLRK